MPAAEFACSAPGSKQCPLASPHYKVQTPLLWIGFSTTHGTCFVPLVLRSHGCPLPSPCQLSPCPFPCCPRSLSSQSHQLRSPLLASGSLLWTSSPAQAPVATTISASSTLIVVPSHLTDLFPFFSLLFFLELPLYLWQVTVTPVTSWLLQIQWMSLYQVLPLFLRDLHLQGFPNRCQALRAPPDLAVPAQSPGKSPTLPKAQDPMAAPGMLQQGCSPAPRSPAQPGHEPHQAGPTHRPPSTAHPVPGEVSGAALTDPWGAPGSGALAHSSFQVCSEWHRSFSCSPCCHQLLTTQFFHTITPFRFSSSSFLFLTLQRLRLRHADFGLNLPTVSPLTPRTPGMWSCRRPLRTGFVSTLPLSPLPGLRKKRHNDLQESACAQSSARTGKSGLV